MNNNRVVLRLGILSLFAILAISTASAHVTIYFVPQDTIVPEGGSAYVELWMDVTDPDTVWGGQVAIQYDPSCVVITEHPVNAVPAGWGPCIDYTMCSWNANPDCSGPGYDMIMFKWMLPIPNGMCPGPQMLANFTVHCNSSEYCLSTVSAGCGEVGCSPSCKVEVLTPVNENLWPDNVTFVDGTFTCGEAPIETFEKELVLGWNLISMPLTPADSSTSAVLSSMSGNYNTVYRYDAVAKQFEEVTTGTMDPGIGYFVDVTTAGAWTYQGTSYDEMSVGLKQGLNLVGWVNASVDLPDAFDSIAGKYNYVARWDATSIGYELYDANAPIGVPEFIDFTTMERGNGYWIAAKEDCTLTASCP